MSLFPATSLSSPITTSTKRSFQAASIKRKQQQDLEIHHYKIDPPIISHLNRYVSKQVVQAHVKVMHRAGQVKVVGSIADFQALREKLKPFLHDLIRVEESLFPKIDTLIKMCKEKFIGTKGHIDFPITPDLLESMPWTMRASLNNWTSFNREHRTSIGKQLEYWYRITEMDIPLFKEVLEIQYKEINAVNQLSKQLEYYINQINGSGE